MVRDERVARHLHIPLQAGSDKVLKLMHRPYDTVRFMKWLDNIRDKLPDISISSDVIVGFPQESDEDFARGCEFIKKTGMSFTIII